MILPVLVLGLKAIALSFTMMTEKNSHPSGPFVNGLENATPEKVPEYCSMYSRTSTLLIHVSCVLLFNEDFLPCGATQS